MPKRIASFSRTLRGLYDYLQTPPWADWKGAIHSGIEERETRFLEIAGRTIFCNANHPYHRMFQIAGCDFGDLERELTQHGLEATLQSLARQGVHLTHDEFKGKQAIVRSGEHIRADAGSFANRGFDGMDAVSGGSRSAGTKSVVNTPHCLHAELYHRLASAEFRLYGRRHVLVWGILPNLAAITQGVRYARLGAQVERWFAMGGTWKDAPLYRSATSSCVALARAMGARIPFPEILAPNDFTAAAESIARGRAAGASYSVGGPATAAVRMASRAIEKGFDISGTLFLMGSETLTEAKQAAVEAAGARIYSRYATTELGPVGYACREMRANCVHLFEDSIAAINQRRMAPLSDVEVNSLLFTTLTPYAPHVLINAEFDDCGTIEPARCSCGFATAGFRRQIRGVTSFGKLTGQGVTLVGSEVVRLLEDVLPARFGGAPGDYQLLEQEKEGQTRLTLRVRPGIPLRSPDDVRECLLGELVKLRGGAGARRLWEHSQALEVVRAYPAVTRAGKILPLHLLGSGRMGSGDGS
jgi:hypothetical protein